MGFLGFDISPKGHEAELEQIERELAEIDTEIAA